MAINRGDVEDAADVFGSVGSTLPGGESLAVTATLLGELAQLVHDSGISEFARNEHPVTSSLLDDFAVFGRTEEFFSEVMSYIVDVEADQLAESAMTFIRLSVLGRAVPSDESQSSWADSWWGEIYDHLLVGNAEGALLATVHRGELDATSYMGRLTVHTIESLARLSLLDGALETLVRVKPETAGLVSAYDKYVGDSLFLAIRLEIDRIGPSELGDVLMAVLSTIVVFEEASEESRTNDRGVDAEDDPDDQEDWLSDDDPDTRMQDGQVLMWSEELDTWVGVVVSGSGAEYHWVESRGCWVDGDGREWDIEDDTRLVPRSRSPKVVRMNSGTVVEWSDRGECWIADDGSEWVVDPMMPDNFVDRRMWELINPGRPLPAYTAPKPPRPEAPDRKLEQPTDPADYAEKERLMRVLDKAARKGFDKAGRLYEKSNRIQLAHYRRTGRWLLGQPSEDGWYNDPTGRYAQREYARFNWTERVRASSGAPVSIDPDFPTEKDMEEWRRRLEEWEKG